MYHFETDFFSGVPLCLNADGDKGDCCFRNSELVE